MLRKFYLSLLIACASWPLLAGEPIVIDNTEALLTGEWILGTTQPDKHGSDYHHISTTPGDATATAIYRPDIPSSGVYHVEIFYPQHSNRSTASPWRISCARGEIIAHVNQTLLGGQWLRIASACPFEKGTNGFVMLSNNPPDAGMRGTNPVRVIADAVRFVPAGKDASHTALPINGAIKIANYFLQLTVQGKGMVTFAQQSGADFHRLTLSAQPAEGHVFQEWSGALSGARNPITVELSTNLHIGATFARAGIGAIVDNRDAEFSGQWSVSERAWPGTRYEDYHFSTAIAGEPTATAIFRPNLPKTGLYDVYIWYASGSNRATNALWEVVSTDGTVSRHVDQTVNGGTWVLIASNRLFGEGTGGFARLTNVAEPLKAVVIADAVAFVYKSED